MGRAAFHYLLQVYGRIQLEPGQQVDGSFTCSGKQFGCAACCDQQGVFYSLSQDGLKNLQLSLRILTEPDEDQLIQPKEHTR